MTRQNLYSDRWDGDYDEDRTRRQMFWRPDGARMGATLHELAPGAPESRMHMHFGAEEMFFVLEGAPLLRTPQGEEPLSPGDVVFCPEGRELPRRRRLPRARVRLGGDPRPRSGGTREGRRPGHHRPIRHPHRVAAGGLQSAFADDRLRYRPAGLWPVKVNRKEPMHVRDVVRNRPA
jgi:Cupin domain